MSDHRSLWQKHLQQLADIISEVGNSITGRERAAAVHVGRAGIIPHSSPLPGGEHTHMTSTEGIWKGT